MTFSRILFPTDFSERSLAVIPYVRALRQRFASSLTLLHVVHVPVTAYSSPNVPVALDLLLSEMKEGADERIVQLAATEFAGIAVKTLVEKGDPGSCIAKIAKENDIDLIMIPTHGHGAFRAALLGSVAAKTLHDATCPVWTAAHCEELGANHLEWRNILCAIDTDSEAERLISVAAQLAAGSNAKVFLVHGVDSGDPRSETYGGAEFTEFLKNRAREVIAEMQNRAGTNFAVCVESGRARDVVRYAAIGHNADLVMIGRGVLPRFAGSLRSQASAIVRHAPCPVLSV